MRKLLPLLTLLTCSGFAAEQITLTITVTNHTQTGDTLTINATTRTWTNAHSTSTILTNSLTGPAPTATNLAFNLSAYTILAGSYTVQTNTNTIRIIFPVGTTVAASETGDWATFALYTQVVTRAWTVRVPMTVESSTNQTNFASMLVDGLRKATNSWTPGEMATTNFAALAGHNLWTGTNRFVNGWWTNANLVAMATASGTLGNLTNGNLTNTTLVSPILSNAIAYGGFSSRAAGAESEAIGSTASAAGDYAVSYGQGADATGDYAIAIGAQSSGTGDNSITIGTSSQNSSANSVALGNGATVNAFSTNAIALGQGAVATGSNTIAIGQGVSTTDTNQIMLGRVFHTVRIPGRVEPTGTITNAIFTGTNSLGITGGPYSFLAMRRLNITTLANGNNAGVNPGGATYLKVSGPTAAFAICGITNGTDGYFLLIENNTGFNMTLANDSGVDPVPANRIYTFSNGDLVLDGDSATMLIYDSAVSRWIVIGANPNDVALSYAEIYTDENLGVQTLTSSNTYYLCTNFNTAGAQSILTADAANAEIDIVGAGVYRVGCHGSMDGNANITYTVGLFTNDVAAVNMRVKTKLDTLGELEAFAISGLLDLPTGISIDVRVAADTNAALFLINQGNFTVQKVE